VFKTCENAKSMWWCIERGSFMATYPQWMSAQRYVIVEHKYLATEKTGNQLQGKRTGLRWTMCVHIREVLSRIHGSFEEKYLPRHTITCQGRRDQICTEQPMWQNGNLVSTCGFCIFAEAWWWWWGGGEWYGRPGRHRPMRGKIII